jgi:CheY-like chemotaxis protein
VETVLLIEDEQSLRELTRRMLSRAGYAVLVAASGEQALEVLDAHAEPVDLVLSDVMMPGIGGPPAVERIRERRPGIAVLFMSGYVRTDRDLPLSSAHFLAKPFDRDTLLRAVRAALAARTGG